MFAFLTKLLLVARSRLKSRASLEAENLVLRQQVIVLSRQSRSRVRLRNIDRLIFVWLSWRQSPAILAMRWRRPWREKCFYRHEPDIARFQRREAAMRRQ
jgi:hypothetical protein